MNAVERLLAHGKQALRLFGDAYSPGEWFEPFEFIEAKAIAGEAVELVEWRGWQSLAFLRLAVWRTFDHEPASDRPAEALRTYCELLDERRRLLSPKRLRTLLADAVRESREWGDLSRDVVQRSEAVIAALGRLRKLPGNEVPSSYQDEADERCTMCHEMRGKLRRALRRLHAFEAPQQAGKQAGQAKTGSKRGGQRRQGSGGRPEQYSLKFVREVVAARNLDKRQAAKAKRRIAPFPQWLRDYCSGRNIDIRERIPPAFTGEDWSLRANRFWKAAKARLSRSGN